VLRKEKNHRVGIRRHEQQVGDKHHLKVFANEDAADTWLQENDPEGVAFEYFWSEPDRAAGLSYASGVDRGFVWIILAASA
jgi:hypothetical protein